MKDLTDAQKLDILLSFTGRGYNLKDTDRPDTLKMSLGNGYTLIASINDSWFIEFYDGVATSKYHIESPKVFYTNAKDARNLFKEYSDECKRVLAEKYRDAVPEHVKAEVVDDIEETKTIPDEFESAEIENPDIRKKDQGHKIKLSDTDLIQKINIVLMKSSGDTTLRLVTA